MTPASCKLLFSEVSLKYKITKTVPDSPPGSVTAQQSPEFKVKLGSNVNGDVVVWSDGSVWKQVTVEKMDVTTKSEKKVATLSISNVPAGFQAGKYSNFVGVALRSTKAKIPMVRDPRLMTEVFRKGIPTIRSTKDLPALDAKFEDICLFAWEPAVERLPFKPEYIGQVEKDGKPLGAQFKVTVTHLTISGGAVSCLIRKTIADHAFDEGWYTDIDGVYFGREQIK